MRRTIFSEEHELFRQQVRRFVEKEVAPKVEHWNARGTSDRETWERAGAEGPTERPRTSLGGRLIPAPRPAADARPPPPAGGTVRPVRARLDPTRRGARPKRPDAP